MASRFAPRHLASPLSLPAADGFRRRMALRTACVAALLFALLPTSAALAGPIPTIFITDLTISETSNGPAIAQVGVALDNAPGGTVSVEYMTADGTALANDNDYQPALGQVDFTGPFGSTINETIAITIIGDTIPEPDEFFFIDLFNPDVGVVLGDAQSKVTLLDDDTLGDIEISIEDAVADEGEGKIEFAVRLDVIPQPPRGGFFVQVDYDTFEGTATDGADFIKESGTLFFTSPGEIQRIPIQVENDTLAEPDETLEVKIFNPDGGIIVRERAVGTIRDDDTPPPEVSIADTRIVEGDDGSVDAELVLSLSRPTDESSSVVWSTRDETASAQQGDYRTTNGLVRFDPGDTEHRITVPVFGDLDAEDDETFFVELSNPFGLRIDDGRAVVTIEDDDSVTETPQLAIGDVAVLEGDDEVVDATFVVTLAPPSGEPVTVDFGTADGSATSGTGPTADYQATTGTLLFEPGDTRRELTVRVRGDIRPEEDETFFVRLTAPDGAEIADGEGTGTIRDDDGGGGGGGPLPRARLVGVVVDEGDEGTTPAVFELVLDRPAGEATSVAFATADESAMASDGDYLPATGRLDFAPGALGATLRVDVVGDLRVEDDETFRVELSEPQGLTLEMSSARGVIRNDDEDDDGGGGGGGGGNDGGTVRLLAPPSATENAGPVVLQVERVGPAAGAARALVVTRPGGSATAGADYLPLRQAVTWGPGQTGLREVALRLVDDARQEDDEGVRVVLAEAQGATIGQPSATVLTILDDDTPMRLEVVGDQTIEARARSQVELAVRVVRDDGEPVAGALVDWTLDGAGARLLGPNRGASDEDGVARQVVALGPRPESLRVTVTLVGTEIELVFSVDARGGLVDDVAGGDEAELGVADLLDRACLDAQGEYAQLCDFVYNLDDSADRARAVRALAPSRLVAQARSALRAPRVQIRNVNSRLTALRGGLAAAPLSQLAVAVRGQNIPFGPLLDGDSLRSGAGSLQRAAVRSGLDELAFAHGGLASTSGLPADDQALRGVLTAAVERARADLRRNGPSFAQTADDTAASGAIVDAESPWGFFANGRISFGDAPARGGDPGYDFGTEGLTAGIDYRLGARGVVGAALGYARSDIDFVDDAGRIDLDGWTLSLYGTMWRERWYVDAVVVYGVQDYDSARIVDLPSMFLERQRFTARGSSDGDQLALHLASGVDWTREAWTWGGYGRLSWVEATLEGYTERDAGPLALRFDDQTSTSLLAEAGVEISYAASRSWGILQPLLRLAYLHEFEDGEQLLLAGFAEDPLGRTFAVRSEAPDRDYLNLAAALTATFAHGWSSYLQYDTDLARDDFNLHTVSGGVRFQF
ncbi:MAG: Calx-beta domain-containing protein [Acidobacteriota bacterium]